MLEAGSQARYIILVSGNSCTIYVTITICEYLTCDHYTGDPVLEVLVVVVAWNLFLVPRMFV